MRLVKAQRLFDEGCFLSVYDIEVRAYQSHRYFTFEI